MTGKEFIRKLRRLARLRGLSFREEANRGKGDHRRVWFGGRMTIVGDLGEIKTGTLHGMLKSLGLSLDDLRE